MKCIGCVRSRFRLGLLLRVIHQAQACWVQHLHILHYKPNQYVQLDTALILTNSRYLRLALMRPTEQPITQGMFPITVQGPVLPQELWIMIWKNLILSERFGVSQICRWWRSLARSTPQLWSCIDFHTSRHDARCPCTLCLNQPTKEDTAKRNSAWRPPGTRSSPDLVLVAFSLGRHTPVDLMIEVTHRTTQ